MRVTHTFEPVYNKESRVLVLGTFPSVKSRENAFYYGHPQNRFWKVLAAITKEEVPVSIEGKKNMLLKHGIAIWDVISSCDIEGSSDSSIKNVVPNDVAGILGKTEITEIYGNGGTACSLYDKFCKEKTGVEIIKLPSTSPANAAFSLERLIQCWEILKMEK
ncbi:MAG: DNA-deoxyinosine glycosylase [Kineothrix sp.]|nr:DNA-deoxyinosine glycosylase [Kineothrix sp.]